MSFRGRGRGRGGGRGFGFGGFERNAKKQPYILFPEDVELPSLPKTDTMKTEEIQMFWAKYKLELFWAGSCYHLQHEAFPKLDKSKGGKVKRPKVSESKEEDVDIERYSDRFKRRTHAIREDLESYLKQSTSNFPAELIQGAKRPVRSTKKLRWDQDSGNLKLDIFAKLEERERKDGEESKKSDDDGEEEEEEVVEEGDSDEGDYAQNIDFDDDDEDMIMEDEPEDYYED